MKKMLVVVCAFLAMAQIMLCAAEKLIPVVWKSSLRPPYGNCQTYAFGFLEEKDAYTFVFQIKDLPGFLETQKPFLTCYFNSDGDVKTGLFPNKCGWDLQFNFDIRRNALSVMIWRANSLESTYSFSNGEFSSYKKDDQLFFTVKKNVFFKNTRFVKGFTFAQLLATPELEGKETRSRVETPQKTASGSFGKQAFILPDERLQKLAEKAEEKD